MQNDKTHQQLRDLAIDARARSVTGPVDDGASIAIDGIKLVKWRPSSGTARGKNVYSVVPTGRGKPVSTGLGVWTREQFHERLDQLLDALDEAAQENPAR